MWKKFDHQNITAFLGVDTRLFDLALIYDWAENGDIIQYTEKHRDASRPSLVLIIFLNDVSHLTLFLVTVVGGCEGFTIPPFAWRFSRTSKRGKSRYISSCWSSINLSS